MHEVFEWLFLSAVILALVAICCHAADPYRDREP